MAQKINHRALVAGGIGNILEWYDFAIYGFLAPVLAVLFFPSDDPVVSLIAAFGVFAAGYLMRPVGSLILGHVGDRMGRKPALTLSIALMAIPTGLMTVLPTHATAGVGAAIMLTVLRLLQGISVGGEFTGSAVFLTEGAPKMRRGLVGSTCMASATLGILLASAIAALLTSSMSTEAFSDWGWRLAFVPGPILGVVGFFLRRHIQETNAPSEASKHEPMPIVVAFREHGGAMLRVSAIAAAYGVVFYLSFVYLTTYLTDAVKLSRAEALDINTAAMVIMVILVPTFALLSDRVGRRPIMLAGFLGLVIFAYPLFILLHSGDLVQELVGDFSLAILISAIGGPVAAQMVELFPRNIRYTGVSVAYSLTMGVCGGTAPLVATWLIAESGNDFAPAFYMIGFAALGVLTLLFTPETNDRDLD